MLSKMLVEQIEWDGVRCRVRHEPDFRGNSGWSRIDIQVLTPLGHPLPIAESGYHSHQLDSDELAAAGGAAVYFRAWLELEKQSYRYEKALARYRQGDLFG